MKKRIFYTEISYIVGLLILAFGTALMERTDFGVSMVVAPAYILHLKISEFLPFFSFGMAEYTLQAVVLLLMMIILRRVKLSYFFSFVTAVLYGLLLDGSIAVVAFLPYGSLAWRLLFYAVGMLCSSTGVALLFHTYISPEAYELFVKEISTRFGFDIHKCKTLYDCASCLIAIVLSFAFFGWWHFEGIKLGTVFCAFLNGTLIRLFTKLLEKRWTFEDALPLKKYF